MTLKKIIIVLIFLAVSSCSQKRMLQIDGFSDPFCAIFDQQTGECVGCICRGYFDINRRCRAVSDLCQTWNINTGQCTSCYRGYELMNDTCVALGFYIPGEDTQLTIQNPNCLSDNGNGTCTSCRPYYVLYCGDCQTTGQNPFCSKFDPFNTCLECDSGFELDVNNICQSAIVTNCSDFQNCLECNSAQCTKCEQGYKQEFDSKQCVLPTTNCSLGCALCSPNQCFECQRGYSAQSWPICINCSFMFSRNSKGECKAIQSDCSSYANCKSCVQDQCTSCQIGYKLNSSLQCQKTF